MFCKHCGGYIDEGTAVCSQCGTPVEETSEVESGIFGKSKLLPILIFLAGVIVALVIAIVVIVILWRPSVSNQVPETVPTVALTEPETLPPTEATEPPTEAPTEPEVTETQVDYPYTDENGVVYELVEPYPIPIANPNKDIYDRPGGNYIGDFNTIGYYTIVEQAEDPNGYTWGKLSTGEGWTMVYQQILPNLNMNFGSGVGNWGTTISINGTGFFSGNYHDSNMGEYGYNHPNGTVYTCDFDGKFNVIGIGSYTVTLKLASLKSDVPQGRTWISNGILYVATEPYGLEDTSVFVLYTPNTPVSELPDSLLSWMHGRPQGGQLGRYALYSPATGHAFFS